MRSFVLRGVHVLEESGGFSERTDVAVDDGVVVEVAPNASAPEAPSYDLDGLWLMPGVFDCHLHIAASSLDAMELMRTPITQWTLEAASHMRKTLESGVTFVRDAAGADAGMREAVARALVPAPRLQVAVVALSQTGGHVDGFRDYRDLVNITRGLVSRGYSDDDIRAILGENFLRVFEEVVA